VIFFITNGDITVAGDFVVSLRDGRRHLVGVKIPPCLNMQQSDHCLIGYISDRAILIKLGLISVGVEEPIIVGIFVVVASDLLLGRPFRISLDVRVKEAAPIPHILQSGLGAVGNFQGAVSTDFRPFEIGLEQ
jgi:hypothetical protein